MLITQWAGEVWELLYKDLKESIIRSFRKCGITVALDGSENISSDSDDEYEPGSNSRDKDAVGEGVIVGKGDADTVGGELQE